MTFPSNVTFSNLGTLDTSEIGFAHPYHAEFFKWVVNEHPDLGFRVFLNGSLVYSVTAVSYDYVVGKIEFYNWRSDKITFTGSSIRMERGNGKKTSKIDVAKKIFKEHFKPLNAKDLVGKALPKFASTINKEKANRHYAAHKVVIWDRERLVGFAIAHKEQFLEYMKVVESTASSLDELQAGLEEFEKASIDLHDKLRTLGNGFIVIKTGDSYLACNVTNGPEYRPDHASLKSGSFESLPIIVQERLGMLNICPDETFLGDIGMRIGNLYMINGASND